MAAWPLHPFLFAAVFPAYLLSHNLNEQVPVADVLASVAVVTVGSGLTLCALRTLLRSAAWGAVSTTIVVLWLLGFGEFQSLLPDQSAYDAWPLAAWSLGALALVVAATVRRRRLHRTTMPLNALAAALLLVNAVAIIPHGIATALTPDYDQSALESRSPGTGPVGDGRDIYYIVPDRYPSQATLAGPAFNFDNGEFLSALEQRGFYVAEDSYANYISTPMSLASSLNMTYLDLGAMRHAAPAPGDPKAIHDMLAGSLAAPAFLKAHAYTYIQIPSWYSPTAAGAEVDVRLRHRALSEFGQALYEGTAIANIARVLDLTGSPGETAVVNALYQFERLHELEHVAGPKFVYAHILLPHPPYVFDASGPLPPSSRVNGVADQHPEQFPQQLEYTNQRTIELVDHLQSGDSDSHPIIIIQADEGPHLSRPPADWRDASALQYQQKFAILNAYYLPNGADAQLYPSITPGQHFQADLQPLLRHRSPAA